MKKLIEYMTLFCVGGMTYVLCEFIFRGYSHASMFVAGGICFILVGLINEVLPWEMPIQKQMLIGAIIITTIEFIVGLIVNIWLGWNVWNYSSMRFNIRGQICPQFTVLWFFISGLAIILDDLIRWLVFNEEKPHYSLKKR